MSNEKKIWLCEQYAQKAWTLSLALAQEAARAGQFGKGYAVVAEEARTLANKLFQCTANIRFHGEDHEEFCGIADFATKMCFLSTNTMLEIMRVNPIAHDMTLNKSMAVLAEDLRRLSMEVRALTDDRVEQKPMIMTEITSPIQSSTVYDFFFRFSIGGIPLVENTNRIYEVLPRRKNEIESEAFSSRGRVVPVINCYKQFGLTSPGRHGDMQTVLMINPEGTSYSIVDETKLYAVPIDDLDEYAIFSSRIGRAVPPRGDSAFADYTRECWDAVGGDQLMFVNWQKLISE